MKVYPGQTYFFEYGKWAIWRTSENLSLLNKETGITHCTNCFTKANITGLLDLTPLEIEYGNYVNLFKRLGIHE